MVKYAMLRDQLALTLPAATLLEAPCASDGELALAHSPTYVASIVEGSISAAARREIGFPWSLAMGGAFAPLRWRYRGCRGKSVV